MMTLAEKISWWSILAAVFLVPIAMSNCTWLGFEAPWTFDQFDTAKVFVMRACLLVALGAWAWHILVEGGRVRRTPVEWAVLAFLAWVTISAALSVHPPTALLGKYQRFEGLLSFITYAVMYWLVLQLADRPSRFKQLAVWLFWGGVIVASYGVLQNLGLDPIEWSTLPFERRRAFSTYGNPNLLGGWLMFALPISVGLALSETRTKWRIVWWIGVLLNVYVWIVAFTRAAWIGGVVGLVALAIFAWRQRASLLRDRSNRVVDISLLVVTVLVVVATIVASSYSPSEVMNFERRVTSIVQSDQGSAETRTEIWQAAIAAIADRPLFGFGADTFRMVFPKYKPIEYVKDARYHQVADNAHNYPLQLASGVGVPGALLMYVIFFWVAVRSVPYVWRLADGDVDVSASRLLLGAFWAASAAYVTLLMFGLSVTGTTLYLWISMAVLLSPGASSREAAPVSWGRAAAVIAGTALAVLFILNGAWVYADHIYQESKFAAGTPERLALGEKAVRINPFNDAYRSDLASSYGSAVSQIAEAQKGAVPTEEAKALFQRAVVAHDDAIRFAPLEYDNYVFLANLYNVASTYLGADVNDKALEVARKGIEVEPFGPAIRLQYAYALSAAGDLKGAREQLEYAVSMDPGFKDGVLALAQAHAALGDLAAASKVLADYDAIHAGDSQIADALSAIEASRSGK